MAPELIVPDWPAPANVGALQTTRRGGVSREPYASLNLGDHVGDDPGAVLANRRALAAALPGEPVWLAQVHGTAVADAATARAGDEADAIVARIPRRVCVVLTADCLPILLCDRRGTVVAAVHAGWRGLAAGVVEAAVAAMGVPGGDLLAWLGPAIGGERFEVGAEVRAAFVAADAGAAAAFRPRGADKWLADLEALARRRLERLGLPPAYGGGRCTAADSEAFFSYRRDGRTGRLGSFVWLDRPGV